MIKRSKTHNNLIISAVGDNSLHEHWTPAKDFDLFLIYYGNKDFEDRSSTFCMKKAGTKYGLIMDAIEKHPEILTYDYIWMPDDDIHLRGEEISRLFAMSREYKLWLSQPSLMGWYGLKITLHQHESILRYTNYVEIMCPCFSGPALKKCLSTFRENKTGWGIDHVWNKLLGNPTNKIAIIDDIVAVHTRPVGGGDMYKNQTNDQIEIAQKENYEIYKKYNMKKSSYEDLKHGQVVSTESFGLSYYNLVEYGRVFKQEEAGIPVSERLWPPTKDMSDLCANIRKEDSSAIKKYLQSVYNVYGTHV